MGRPRMRVRCTIEKNEIQERPGERSVWIHECIHVCVGRQDVCTAASHSFPATNPVSPIPPPLTELVHHAGSEAPWRGRICAAALLCLVLHITSRGIDIPQPFLSPSLLSSGAAPAAACSLFRGSKKSSRRSKNSSAPALPRLGAACLPACRSTWIPTRSPTTITISITTTTRLLLLHPQPST